MVESRMAKAEKDFIVKHIAALRQQADELEQQMGIVPKKENTITIPSQKRHLYAIALIWDAMAQNKPQPTADEIVQECKINRKTLMHKKPWRGVRKALGLGEFADKSQQHYASEY